MVPSRCVGVVAPRGSSGATRMSSGRMATRGRRPRARAAPPRRCRPASVHPESGAVHRHGDARAHPGRARTRSTRPAAARSGRGSRARRRTSAARRGARGGADLLHAPALHHRDAVGEAQRLDLVVGDEEHRDAEPPLEELHLHPHLLAQLGVEVAEGLVEQQQIRLVDERAAERQALHLAAAQQRGRAASRVPQVDQVEHARRPCRGRTAFARPRSGERIGHVLEHGHVRPDRVGLEHHAEVARVRRHEEPARARRPPAGRAG